MKDHYLKRVRHQRDVVFTRSEVNDKKYTVADAVTAAQVVLDGKRKLRQPRIQVSITALQGRSLSEKISILELNRIQDHLVNEALWAQNSVQGLLGAP